jgi:hypothetical protein
MINDLIKFGVVEDIDDPLQDGRVKVRIFGVHSDNTTVLPTSDLPWAMVGQQTGSAALSGIGTSPRLLRGSWVCGFHVDAHQQKFVVLCSISGVPGAMTAPLSALDSITANIPPATPPAQLNGIEQAYVGILTNSQVMQLAGVILANDSTLSDRSALDLVNGEIKTNYTSLASAGVISATTIVEKSFGVLYAAHFAGVTPTLNYITSGKDQNVNGNSIFFYYNAGYSAYLGVDTAEIPTKSNLNSPASDRSSGTTLTPAKPGFADPTGEYPLADYAGEPDINRLARGADTDMVGVKENNRITGVAIANSSVTWDQSPIPYNAEYPYNQVIASEAGHVIEIDDTPGSERLNFHHAAGTFHEIDHQGNSVERVKGIRTIIVEQDELVNIIGSGHVNLGGDLSVMIGGSCNIQIAKDLNISVGGQVNWDVTGAFNMSMLQGALTSSGGILLDSVIGSAPGGAPAPSVKAYSPTITIPTPFERRASSEQSAEGHTASTVLLYANAPAYTIIATDTSALVKVIGADLTCNFGQIAQDQDIRFGPEIPNYTLKDLCRNHPFPYLNGQWSTSPAVLVCNLKQLAYNVIERILSKPKYATQGFVITSCFREAGSKDSKAIGTSPHELGRAVDINFMSLNGQANTRALYYAIAVELKNVIPFNKLILEFSPTKAWIHIEYVGASSNLYQTYTYYCDKKIADGLVQIA